MNPSKAVCLMFSIALVIGAQSQSKSAESELYAYNVSASLPFGKPNPEAPDQIKDYAELIGVCKCVSQTRSSDETWAQPVDMQWTFKYIMNGKAVQDETLKSDGRHSGSIRQFNADSLKWYVHYYSSQKSSPLLAAWEGGRKGDEIVLYRAQKSPNGREGFYKIRFHDISDEGFQWVGMWTPKDEEFVYETWKISCKKVK